MNPLPTRPPGLLPSLTLLLLGIVASPGAAGSSDADLERRFRDMVRPFVATYCLPCHDREQLKGDFDLSPYSRVPDVVRDLAHWDLVLDKLQTGDMPPRKAKEHPTPAQVRGVVTWIQDLRRAEAERNAGDPGPVLARRLSNAEYDNSIRDLTGVDLRPTREFPVDPANPDGFDNSGESLAMSPALLKKYLQAARHVADHLVFAPDGLTFATHPMVTDTDRDKYCVRRIIEFYQRQPTDLAAYFDAAWRWRHRARFGERRASLADTATRSKVSPRYLELIWATLHDPQEVVGPIARLQSLWQALPVPERNQPELARPGCAAMRDFVVGLRRKLVPDVRNLTAPAVNNGSQCLVLWKNRQFAANRRGYDPAILQIEGTLPPNPGPATTNQTKPPDGSTPRRPAKAPAEPDPDLTVPADPTGRAGHEAAFGRFCAVFPDAFYVSERARIYLDPKEDKDNDGRLLSAGFHLMTGYFRDDEPLCDLILSEAQRRELDRLWTEFEVIAELPQRMHTSFIWFERAEGRFLMDAEFDFARAEDKDSTSPVKVRRLADGYLAKAKRTGAGDTALGAMRDHFERVSTNLRRVERLRSEAEPGHLAALLTFAERARRRPLPAAEGDDLVAFYRSLRAQERLSHEDALRDTVVSVLMSPHFCYRIDLVEASGRKLPDRTAPGFKTRNTGTPAANGALPLSDHALASRLSYFLWSSAPDQALLDLAAAGDLHRPAVIAAQARRMLQDDRVRGLALEFGGHWLDFRRFEEHNAVDRQRFPTFDDSLRQAMFEEPVRFILHVVRANRPVLEFLDADYTFVNPVLAKHYGLTIPTIASNAWVQIDHTRSAGRGGLLPMSVFLTANSPGLRTSPVKRGYWVARRVLGERIPPPPATVPELPADEAMLGELTLRETLARHRADPACASCHERFDALGLVFEGFGPVGEARSRDLGDRPVDTHATFPGGSAGTGLDGLRQYIKAHRQSDFLDNLCRKLLAYALGRSLIPSDEITVRDLRSKLAANRLRFGTLVEGIVTSPQFLNKRAPENLVSR